jgi:hypothetical protein
MTDVSRYEIPLETWSKPRSEAFHKFYDYWFQNSFALTRGEIDVAFLADLTPEELQLARNLVRSNLGLRETHLVEGAAQLNDVESIPRLRDLCDTETNPSRKLTISGALWKLAGDERFVGTILQMVASMDANLKQAHFHQILWLGNEVSIRALIDLLSDNDRFVSYLALAKLNELEYGHPFSVSFDQLPSQPSRYQSLRDDKGFCGQLATSLRAKLDRNPYSHITRKT